MIFHCTVENHHNEPSTEPYDTDLFPLTKLTLIIGPTTYGTNYLLDAQIQKRRISSARPDWRIELFPETGVHPSRLEDMATGKLRCLHDDRLEWLAVRTHSLEVLDAFLEHPELPEDTTVVWVADVFVASGGRRDVARCSIITLKQARYKRREYHEDLR